jgi:hypothetical protein
MLKSFSHRVVKGGPNLADQLTLPVGPGSVGEKHDCNPGFKVDPKGTSAIAKMSNGLRGKVLSGGRFL